MADAREVIARAVDPDAVEGRSCYRAAARKQAAFDLSDAILAALAEAGLAVVPRDAAMHALEIAEAMIARENAGPHSAVHPLLAPSYERDMEPLRRLRAALAAAEDKRDG